MCDILPAEPPAFVALVDACIGGAIKPTDMRTALYCWRLGYVAPRYLDASGKRTLALILDVNEEYLRQRLLDLHDKGIMLRQRDDAGFHRYALNPDYRYEGDTPCPTP